MAQSHAATIAAWWRANRAGAPRLFSDELSAAVALLAATPRVGKVYERASGTRRILIGRSGYHVYWQFDEAAGTVSIIAVWHSARGRGPVL
jgi:plasmid stabilization system protein ParE